MDDQLTVIRQKYHNKYINETKIDPKPKLVNDIQNHKYVAGVKITKWARSVLKICKNASDIEKIPGIYRYRITIKNTSKILFDDRRISDKNKIMYQFMFNTIADYEAIELFNYCIDIRRYISDLNQPIIIDNEYFYLHPTDREKIIKLWNRVGGESAFSTRFLTDLKYYKSLAIDAYKRGVEG